ncbi:MAG: DEAD/DEAH box helicase family protein [Chloroflexi bacterium]|jgi:predicted DnaQ family exonuclease/DinG family helicase|nr:DEAD/DEAH box helicase family protein [Chloroflexota bacterium]MBT7081380.1 DEAD/DEAH box helicase family protein [Chloroflexota bacterium]MBT7290335.1 DEAD/DEAH box helicase family protein [Chloroflexota bacterium]
MTLLFSFAMSKTPIYISLDLETTGLSPEDDAITEIAAVKFEGDRVVDTFHSLVNPHRPIPYFVQRMCGITQEEVDIAPDFSSISSNLESFLGIYPIIGHNIAFDISFLAQNGVVLMNSTYDTYELASLLLPGLSDYSLSGVARHFGHEYSFHRALDDAQAGKDIFGAMLKLAAALPLDDIAEMEHLVSGTGMSLERLLPDIKALKAQTAFDGDTQAGQAQQDAPQALGKTEALTPKLEKAALDLEELTREFEAGGPLSGAFDSYEYRPQQVEMMHAVAKAFNDNEHLLVEAGTGTGKSIAYLLPAMIYAQRNQTHVVVSTNTINLQEQLVSKDIPQLLSMLNLNIKAVQLKGRSNYLCRRRFNILRHSDGLDTDEIGLILRILVWLKSTQSGDKSELNLWGGPGYAWSRVCAQAESCLFTKCPHFQKGVCFLHNSRQAAESAHIIVINHALLLSDVVSGGNILPSYSHLIIDEAHHLENEATNQFGFKITQVGMSDLLSSLSHDVGGQLYVGLLHQIRGGLSDSGLSVSQQKEVVGLAEAARVKVDRVRDRAGEFFGVFRDFAEQHTQDNYSNNKKYDRQIRLTTDVRVQPGWYKVESVGENLILSLKEILDSLNKLCLVFDALPQEAVAAHEGLVMETNSLASLFGELSDRLKSAVFSPDAEYIYWTTLGARDGTVTLEGAPLHVDTLLQESVFASAETLVLTSATLSTEDTFDYIKGRLGLEYVSELILDAPFDYKNAAMVYVSQDVPEPNRQGYQQALSKNIIDVCLAAGGRTLVLFTSHAALQATHAAIRPALEKQSILVMGQGIDGSPKRLIDNFKSNPSSVLLGAASLWEGVDVVGDALSVLVMVRLPFSVPTDPVFAARSETFDDSFTQYALPQSILRFKQGFGRLIRSKTDKGVMVVLDTRIKSRRYGASYLSSLPPATILSGPSANLRRTTVKWLGIKNER